MNNVEKRKPKNEVKFAISLNEEQKIAKEQILQKPISFLFGRAGSGKTLLAVQIALDMFFKRDAERIIITRPTVSSEDNGFIPGNIQEKLDPWLVPIRDNMRKVYPHPEKLEKMEVDKQIELVALTHFRGRTFDNAVCIVDEFQNLTEKQLEMCIGRLGKGSIMIFCGDLDQIDLQTRFTPIFYTVDALKNSQFVNHITLLKNHRHPALIEIFELIAKNKHDGNTV